MLRAREFVPTELDLEVTVRHDELGPLEVVGRVLITHESGELRIEVTRDDESWCQPVVVNVA